MFEDARGKKLAPGVWDMMAFPCLWEDRTYDIALRTTYKITRRDHFRFLLYRQTTQAVCSPQLFQEYTLAVASEDTSFKLACVRDKLARWKKANRRDIHDAADPEAAARIVEAMPRHFHGACETDRVVYC